MFVLLFMRIFINWVELAKPPGYTTTPPAWKAAPPPLTAQALLHHRPPRLYALIPSPLHIPPNPLFARSTAFTSGEYGG